MSADERGLGDPVQWLHGREPWGSPTYLPGAPHNLPAPGDRLRPHGANLIGGPSSLADAPYNPAATVQPVRDRHRYARVIEVPMSVDVLSAQLLQEPSGLRNFLFFRNASSITCTLYFGFGQNATAQSMLALTKGQQVLFDTVVPQNEIFVISDTFGALVVAAYSQFSPN